MLWRNSAPYQKPVQRETRRHSTVFRECSGGHAATMHTRPVLPAFIIVTRNLVRQRSWG